MREGYVFINYGYITSDNEKLGYKVKSIDEYNSLYSSVYDDWNLRYEFELENQIYVPDNGEFINRDDNIIYYYYYI